MSENKGQNEKSKKNGKKIVGRGMKKTVGFNQIEREMKQLSPCTNYLRLRFVQKMNIAIPQPYKTGSE